MAQYLIKHEEEFTFRVKEVTWQVLGFCGDGDDISGFMAAGNLLDADQSRALLQRGQLSVGTG
jgi:hypothetical protein